MNSPLDANSSRPRPPASNRRSTASGGASSSSTSKPQYLRGTSLPSSTSGSMTSVSIPNISSILPSAMEADLDLDLPPELAAALGSSQSSNWSRSRDGRLSEKQMNASNSSTGENLAADQTVIVKPTPTQKDHKSASVGRKLGSKISRSLGGRQERNHEDSNLDPLNRGLTSSEAATQNTSDASSGGSPSSSPKSTFSENLATPQPNSNLSLYEQELQRDYSGEDDDDECGSGQEEDEDQRAWMEKLPRNDLEALLLQANQVIRERERDLSMAATIGQALLEKNLSLRNKHDGILGRLNSRSTRVDEETPNCSPPTTDMDLPPEVDNSSLKTPIPNETPDAGYFEDDRTPTNHGRERPQLSSLFQGSPSLSKNHTSFPSSGGSFNSDISSAGRKHWQGGSFGSPSRSLYGPSQPASPSVYGDSTTGSPIKRRTVSGASNHSALYKAQVEIELASLQQQNDALLAQMSELKAEAERNQMQGGKRLRTFHKEIDSLTKALEDASQRNAELEEENTRKEASAGSRKIWRRKAGRISGDGTSDSEATDGEETPAFSPPDLNDRFRHFPKGSLTPALTRSPVKGQASPALSRSGSISDRSDVSLTPSAVEAALNNVPRTSGERALISQLLAKISELEEANSHLTNTQDEINGRIGSLIQEGARISDAYDAVNDGNEMDQDCQEREDDNEVSRDGDSSANVSPARRRRAPGNPLKRERRESAAALSAAMGALALPKSGTSDSLTSNSTSISFGSSSSGGSIRKDPRRRASASSLGKPRIRITPSAEDLASRNRADSKEMELNANSRYKSDSLKPSDALSFRAARPRSKRQDVTAIFSKTLRRVLSNASFNGSLASTSSVGSELDFKQPSTFSKRKPRHSFTHDGLTPGSSYASDLNQVVLPSFESFETTSSIAGDVDSAALRLKYGYGLEEQAEMRARSLESELGSVYGGRDDQGDETQMDQDDDDDQDRSSLTHRQQSERGDMSLSMSLSELQLQSLPQQEETPSPTRLALPIQIRRGSTGSLAESISAVSDIGNLAFSVSSKASTVILDPPVTRAAIGSGPALDEDDFPQDQFHNEGGRELILKTSPTKLDHLLKRAMADGEWTAGDDIVPRGALKDGEMTQNDTYDQISKAAQRQPVHWADDDDFGKPIAESEARRIGLVETDVKTRRGLLGWRIRSQDEAKAIPPKLKKGKGKARSSNSLAIEDAAQVEERESLSELLRLKRTAALQARAEIDGKVGRIQKTIQSSRSSSSNGDYSLDSEVTARTLAIASARYKRINKPDYYGEESSTPKNRSPSKANSNSFKNKRSFSQADGIASSTLNSKLSRSTSLKSQRFDEEKEGLEEEQDGNSSDSEEFELVDLDAGKRRPGRRGTDYFPVATTARYRPAMVRQRVTVASSEAIMWATAWIGFATVMIFAFCVAFSRGPKRVMGANPGVRQPGPRR